MAFTLKVSSAAALAEAEKKGLHKQFKLSTSLSTSNMTLFDEQGRIHKWETPEKVPNPNPNPNPNPTTSGRPPRRCRKASTPTPNPNPNQVLQDFYPQPSP